MEAQAFFAAIGAIETHSEHSIAQAVVQAAKTQAVFFNPALVTEFQPVIGMGVFAHYQEAEWAIGSQGWMAQLGVAIPEAAEQAVEAQEAQMRSCVWVARAGQLVGWLSFEDPLREDAQALIDALRATGLGLTLLTGDRLSVAQVVAAKLGGGMEVIAEVLPQDKDAAVQALQMQGKKVLMVGDGVNDAPALLRANIGVALGSGTDVSLDSADIVLTHNRLMDVYAAQRLSARTLRTVKQNIGLSLTYNAIMVPLAMAAVLTPMWAAITMPLSSLLVIGNAARLRGFKK
jgi:Cu2+-exporting ATPase